ncbi:MAG: hypothetical protein HZB38_02160 [Planctomycetes bacterium]|nr:hypothetical protein [Planctomycetota bacterium]
MWEVDGGASLRVTSRGSAMTVLPLSPRERRVVVVGGPADPIEAKAAAGRTWAYYGSDANGFERLINPIGSRMPPNAWYRLGSVPTGAERTARAPHWGRIEIEPTMPATEHYFVTVLVLGDAADQQSANGSCEVGEGITVRLALGEERVEISLSAPAGKGGKIRIGEREWRLPTDVAPDEPWPTR